MAKGGKRIGAGRPKGAASKMNEAARAKAAEEGITPLAYMLAILRDDTKDSETRMDAAKSAAPYLHARLAAVELSGNLSVNHEEALDELDRPGKENTAKPKG